MSSFSDNFSQQAGIYVQYRPHYPKELFAFLSSLTGGHTMAWDCGTGNGQAATGLAGFYERIIATDPSQQQIDNSLPHERITYRVEKAEETTLEDHSADLLTIANAMHWFDLDVFYTEARRVLKPGGVIAAWCYGVPAILPEIDEIVQYYHDTIVGKYWVRANRLVEQEYKTIPFPFERIACPAFFSEKMMGLDDFIAYLDTWSATQKYINEYGHNPTAQLREQLLAVWNDATQTKKITWKLVLIAGRV